MVPNDHVARQERWLHDIRKQVGRDWYHKAQNRKLLQKLGKAYDQKWQI